jgi:hypothetical protein
MNRQPDYTMYIVNVNDCTPVFLIDQTCHKLLLLGLFRAISGPNCDKMIDIHDIYCRMRAVFANPAHWGSEGELQFKMISTCGLILACAVSFLTWLFTPILGVVDAKPH